MADAVTYEVKDQVGYLTLNQPDSMNSLTMELVDGLHHACDELIPNSDARAILFRGEGRSFCAGGNIANFQATQPVDNLEDLVQKSILKVEGAIAKLLAIEVPVIASVQGSVAGAGISVMLTSDLILAAENTKFTLAYTKIGLSPDGGSTYLVPRAVGPRKALELYLTNELFLADKAHQWGLINQVEPEDQVLDQATKLAKTLASGPTLAFIKAKRLVHASWGNDLDSQYALERKMFLQSFTTQDFMRGVAAFMAKEPPKFEGN